MGIAKRDDVLARALATIRKHPAVVQLAQLASHAGPEIVVDVTFELGLPNAWRTAGRSPNGVLLYETVRLIFPPRFPLFPPTISLRPDFDRSHPHLQPYTECGRPVPCIYDGRLIDLLHHEGLVGILNQTAVWLERAALAQLIDPAQGWEPVRRDTLDDFVVADAAFLRSLVQRDGGWSFFKFEYVRFIEAGRTTSVHGELMTPQLQINQETVKSIFKEPDSINGSVSFGSSAALVVWPGKRASGELIINTHYLPETVANVDELEARAELYGCSEQLRTALNFLKAAFAPYKAKRYPLLIFLCVRRPANIIGSNSPIELCPYLVDVVPPGLFAHQGKTPVRPTGHRHAIGVGLLRQMAGERDIPNTKAPFWTLIGCGSIGSKIALHLARAGRAPSAVVDKAMMSPHNAARHGLLPRTDDFQIHWLDFKAKLLTQGIEALGQKTVPFTVDAIHLVTSAEAAKRAWSKRTWAVVNATASLPLREALAAAPLKRLPARVIETSLYADGRLGLMAVEGPGRNPHAGDLIAATYAILSGDPAAQPLMFRQDGGTAHQPVGEGCGSMTMAVSDARVSMWAAAMAERITQMQRSSLPTSGEVSVGLLAEDGVTLTWRHHSVPPVTVVHPESGSSWQVRLHQRALEKIAAEVAAWPDVETGGILVGRISEVSHFLQIVDVLPAPPDSERSAVRFTLGVQGVRAMLSQYAEASGYSLYCLGTWHSHLSPSGPSQVDQATASAVALARIAPSVLLIHTPTGFRALIAEDVR